MQRQTVRTSSWVFRLDAISVIKLVGSTIEIHVAGVSETIVLTSQEEIDRVTKAFEDTQAS